MTHDVHGVVVVRVHLVDGRVDRVPRPVASHRERAGAPASASLAGTSHSHGIHLRGRRVGLARGARGGVAVVVAVAVAQRQRRASGPRRRDVCRQDRVQVGQRRAARDERRHLPVRIKLELVLGNVGPALVRGPQV